MIIFIAFLLSFLAATVEATLWHIPLTLLVVIFFGVWKRQHWVFLLALVAGIACDALLFRPLGTSSLFFLLTVGVLFLYRRKFETNNLLFSVCYTTGVSTIYLLIFGSNAIVFALGSIAVVSGIVFSAFFFARTFFSRKDTVSLPFA